MKKCLQRNSGFPSSSPSPVDSPARLNALLNAPEEGKAAILFWSCGATSPLDGRATLGFLAATELLLTPGPQGGSASAVDGRTLCMVNNWGQG